MTWVKTGDEFTERPMWDGVSYEARWHYLALVGLCSRQRRWDGLVPAAVARRASDVGDPDGCHRELADAGALKVDAGTVSVINIDEHIPSPAVRANSEQAKERMRTMRERQRLHALGNHTRCTSGKCHVL